MRTINEISQAMAEGKAVSPEEFAYLLHNSQAAMITFLIKNNLAGVNHVLRHKLGYNHELGFKPDEAKIGRICDLLIQRKDIAALRAIVDGTPVDLKKISPQVLTAIKSYKHNG